MPGEVISSRNMDMGVDQTWENGHPLNIDREGASAPVSVQIGTYCLYARAFDKHSTPLDDASKAIKKEPVQK